MYTSIISCEDAALHHTREDCVMIDCRYDLADTSAGPLAFAVSHIAGAVFADVHDDLSGPPVTDRGRHPLPTAEKLRAVFSSLGIDAGKQVVAYDTSSGAFAARLWWLLRYMGHEAVAVLDGGWQAWQAARLPVEGGACRPRGTSFTGEPNGEWLVLIDHVPDARLLVDSREASRYRGEEEPIDPVAGHIPGALNRCWKENLGDSGCFLPSTQLEQEFEGLYSGTPPGEVVFYCGSGVSACHNILAAVHGGLPSPRLYAGSWSEWCRDPGRPVKTGGK